MTDFIQLKLENISEKLILRLKVLTEDNKEIISKNIDNNKVILNIPKEYRGKPLKLILENKVFSNNKEASKELFIYVLTTLGFVNEEGFLGNPITYIYDFILFNNAVISFNKSDKDFLSTLDNNVKTLKCEKVLYKTQYKRWLIYTFIPIELLILFLIVVIGGVLSKYFYMIIIACLIIQLVIYFYINNVKNKCSLIKD